MYQVVLEGIQKKYDYPDEASALYHITGADSDCYILHEGNRYHHKKVLNDFKSNFKAAHYLQAAIDPGPYLPVSDELMQAFKYLLGYIKMATNENKILLCCGPESYTLLRILNIFVQRPAAGYQSPLDKSFRAYDFVGLNRQYYDGRYYSLVRLGFTHTTQRPLAVYNIDDIDQNFVFNPKDIEAEPANLITEICIARIHENINTLTIFGMPDNPMIFRYMMEEQDFIDQVLDRCILYYTDIPIVETDVAALQTTLQELNLS